MKRYLLTTAALAMFAFPAYAQSVSKGSVQRLNLDSITLDSTVVTATGAELNILDGVTATAAELNILDTATLDVNELNQLDVSAVSFSSATYYGSAVPIYKQFSISAANLNAGNQILPAVASLKWQLIDFVITGDGATSGCPGVIFENGDNVVFASANLEAINAAGTFDIGGGTIIFTSASQGKGESAVNKAVSVKTSGADCATSTEFNIGVTATLAP